MLIIIGNDETTLLNLEPDIATARLPRTFSAMRACSPRCDQSARVLVGTSAVPARGTPLELFFVQDCSAKPSEAYAFTFEDSTDDKNVVTTGLEKTKAFLNAIGAERLNGKFVLVIDQRLAATAP